MSPFELVFALFGLLLGLAIAEVLGGFSRALKLKRGAKAVRIGWLTPMLGLFVVIDLTSFWLMAYSYRDQFVADHITLLAVLVIVGIYYLAATLIFPDDPADWPDFDAWYDKQNRLVLGGMLAANVGSWLCQIALEIVRPLPETEEISDAAVIVDGLIGLSILILLIVLIVVRSRRANVILLALLILLLLVSAVAASIL